MNQTCRACCISHILQGVLFCFSSSPSYSPGAGTLHYHIQNEETGESNHVLDLGAPATLGSAGVGRPGSEEWGLL